MTEMFKTVYENEPTKEPDFASLHGRAWKVPAGESSGPHSQVANWLVDMPMAHPFWHYYMIGAVHLRPVEGVRPAHLRFPSATHEILFVALNPDEPLPDLDDFTDAKFLTPVDLVKQVEVKEDEDVAHMVYMIIRYMLAQGVSPDSDNRSFWEGIIENTADHFSDNPQHEHHH